MKREPRTLLSKSLDSLLLSIEHFNRPWDRGRAEAVLILLDRAFELLLKAAIRHTGGGVRDRGARETYGLDHCVRKCLSDSQVKCLEEEEALTIRIVNSLRDAAQRYCQLGPQGTILTTISWDSKESDPLHLVVVLGHSCSS